MSDQPNTANFPDVHSWVSAHKHEPEKVADLIVWQRKQLDQLANFNPDWDVLKATQDSLNAHMKRLSKAQDKVDELEAENAELLDKPCSMCGQDERIAKIGKRLGFRPDVGALEIRRLEDKQATLITELRNLKRLPVLPGGPAIWVDGRKLTALLDKQEGNSDG